VHEAKRMHTAALLVCLCLAKRLPNPSSNPVALSKSMRIPDFHP
jgi:hypothetical protein